MARTETRNETRIRDDMNTNNSIEVIYMYYILVPKNWNKLYDYLFIDTLLNKSIKQNKIVMHEMNIVKWKTD